MLITLSIVFAAAFIVVGIFLAFFTSELGDEYRKWFRQDVDMPCRADLAVWTVIIAVMYLMTGGALWLWSVALVKYI